MIGDAYQAVKRWAYQNLFCPHFYQSKRTPAGCFTWEECIACKRTKNWSHNR